MKRENSKAVQENFLQWWKCPMPALSNMAPLATENRKVTSEREEMKSLFYFILIGFTLNMNNHMWQMATTERM